MKYIDLLENKLKDNKIKLDYLLEKGSTTCFIDKNELSMTLTKKDKEYNTILTFYFTLSDTFYRILRALALRLGIISENDLRRNPDYEYIIYQIHKKIGFSPTAVKVISNAADYYK